MIAFRDKFATCFVHIMHNTMQHIIVKSRSFLFAKRYRIGSNDYFYWKIRSVFLRYCCTVIRFRVEFNFIGKIRRFINSWIYVYSMFFRFYFIFQKQKELNWSCNIVQFIENNSVTSLINEVWRNTRLKF